MTDGQSEANEHIDTSHPALRKTTQERIEQNRERYEQLKKNAHLAMPPWTVDDCRFMVWLLEGEWVEQRKRCEVCNATGRYYVSDTAKLFSLYTSSEKLAKTGPCVECNGTGYVG